MQDQAQAFGAEWSASLRRGTEDELQGWLGFALGCCDAADAIALASFKREMDISTKSDRTLVTKTDQAIEQLIRDEIQRTYPGHGLVGEEYGRDTEGASVRWYIDPIDGTHNFIRGVPIFGTLLAVERDGELQVGVLSAPALHERWFAYRGGGAWAIGSAGLERPRRIRASAIRTLAEAQLFYGSVPDLLAGGRTPGFRQLVMDVWRERGIGDFWAYMLVAEGAGEAMTEIGPNTWDLAAPLVIVEEAGGRLTDLDGRRRIDAGEALASNGWLHDELLAHLRNPA